MKYKVGELEGALLDAAVAKAEGMLVVEHPAGFGMFYGDLRWCPSTDGRLGITIIERERIDLAPQSGETWSAQKIGGDFRRSGPTPLIAAMRCFVASKLGEEVELP